MELGVAQNSFGLLPLGYSEQKPLNLEKKTSVLSVFVNLSMVCRLRVSRGPQFTGKEKTT